MPRSPLNGRVIFLVAIAIVGVAFIRPGSLAATVQVDEAVNVAGIFVDYGDGRISHAIVPFTEDTISGVELLRRSGLALLSVEFGGMGEGICAIEETGCDLSACRARLCQTGDPDSPFWQYLQNDSDDIWLPAPLGASSSVIEHGDVDGWFWTGTTPRTTAVTLDTIASETGIDLDTFATSGNTSREAIVVTTGESSGNDAMTIESVLTGIAIVAAIAAVGGFLIVRTRRHT
ncbi:MAG: hypothetical protein WKF63_08200 [Thermomicrobiales bacterium]